MIRFKKLIEEAKIPTIANDLDAGLDLVSMEDKTIWPNEQESFKTGLACAIPPGYVGIIKPRSGLAVKYQLDTKAGVIDASYRGELVVILRSYREEFKYEVKKGDRIAQMIVVPCITQTIEVTELDDTDRGKGGFGSSGK